MVKYNRGDTRRLKSVAMLGAALPVLAALATPAAAQTPVGAGTTVGEVVVTGTLVRGVAPIGANVVSVGEADIQRVGALNTNQLLQQVPVLTTFFNTNQQPGGGFNNIGQAPNIRNIGAAGGNTTLVLIDGHNTVGLGVIQTRPDVSILPPGVLQRVEVLADGGSSLYGADAVGGIVNFITKSEADGLELQAHAAAGAGDYRAADINVTGGFSWNSGSALLSYFNRSQNALLTADLDRPIQDLTALGGSDFRTRNCNPGTITVSGVRYALPTRTANTQNLCDTGRFGSAIPKENQNTLYGSFHQELNGEQAVLDVKAYYSDRVSKAWGAPFTTSAGVIGRNNPFFAPIGAEASHQVDYTYLGVFGRVQQHAATKQYGVTPMLTAELPGDWRLKALADYEHSEVETHSPQKNAAAELAALNTPGLTTATALNPYNLSLTNPTVLAGINNFEQLSTGEQTLKDLRATFDGPLFDLPGGAVRAAAGGEYQRQSIDAFQRSAVVTATTGGARVKATRNISAVFAELVVPIIGEGNALPWLDGLVLDGSIRRDHYSDAGSTTNPKISFTASFPHGFSLRGNWGTAFNAPSLADGAGAVDTRLQVLSTTTVLAPGAPSTERLRPTVQYAGGDPNLKPQTAETYSFGFDYRPEFLDGLTLGATYWGINLDDAITFTPPIAQLFQSPIYQKYYILNPTLAQLQAIQAAGGNLPLENAATLASLYGVGNDPYIFLDLRRKNLGFWKYRGADFYLNYTRTTDFGSVFLRLSGSNMTVRKNKTLSTDPWLNVRPNNSPLQASGTIGINAGGFTASATLNHREGYDATGITATPSGFVQTEVGDYDVVNLAVAYRFSGEGWRRDLTLTLNVDNVAEKYPPFINASGGQANGSTAGRIVNVGLRKHF